MNILLDTHALIWYFEGNLLLSKKARFEIGNSNNNKFISIVSSVYNICFLMEDGTPIIISLCVNDDCRGRFILRNGNQIKTWQIGYQ